MSKTSRPEEMSEYYQQVKSNVIRRTRAQRLKLDNKADLGATSAQKRASGIALELSPKVRELK